MTGPRTARRRRTGGAAGLWLALSAWIACGGLPGAPAYGETAPPSAVPPPADVAAPPPSAIKTATGVAMTVLKKGGGHDHPERNDCVMVHFTGWKRDGSFLASSRLRGEPENQCLQTVFPGVAEALSSMVVGEERRVWIPADLTHKMDDPDEPPSRADVTYDIELLSIQKAPPTPRDLKAPPAAAHKRPSGLALQVLRKGRGGRHPAPGSRMKLHFSGWTTDGRLIESTVMAGRPAVYELEAVIPGWREALEQMVVGEKVRVWIPTALAYGDKPRRGVPRGDLVYELELLELE
jgi:FKBP-type peptidyl-prolyl cis-trans isomerase